MPDIKFTATSRIPTRPLTYANKSLAEKKELLADYENRELYMSDANGNLVCITVSMEKIIERIKESFTEDPTTVTNVTITLDDGTTITIGAAIIQLLADTKDLRTDLDKLKGEVKSLNDALGSIKDEDGNIKISATSIVEDDDHMFVSSTEKNTWNLKSTVTDIISTVKSGSENWTLNSDNESYSQTITIKDMKSTYNPIVDVRLGDSGDLDSDFIKLENFSRIYKITTANGSIKVFSVAPTDEDLSIVLKINK